MVWCTEVNLCEFEAEKGFHEEGERMRRKVGKSKEEWTAKSRQVERTRQVKAWAVREAI